MHDVVRQVAQAKKNGRASPALKIAVTGESSSTVGGRNGLLQKLAIVKKSGGRLESGSVEGSVSINAT
jgi:hypothetical protein